jgi:hypothetical protein
VGCQSRKSEVGSRKSEVGSRKSEVGGRRSDVGRRKSKAGPVPFPRLLVSSFPSCTWECPCLRSLASCPSSVVAPLVPKNSLPSLPSVRLSPRDKHRRQRRKQRWDAKVGSRKSEVRSQKSEVGGRRSDGEGWRSALAAISAFQYFSSFPSSSLGMSVSSKLSFVPEQRSCSPRPKKLRYLRYLLFAFLPGINTEDSEGSKGGMPKSEVRSRRSEVGGRTSEVGWRRLEVGARGDFSVPVFPSFPSTHHNRAHFLH